MTITRETATRIATAINAIRPDWRIDSMVTMIGQRHQHRVPSDLGAALMWIALDPGSSNPGRVNEQGPWWSARSAQLDIAPQPPPMRRGEFTSTDPTPPDRAAEHLARLRETVRTANRPKEKS